MKQKEIESLVKYLVEIKSINTRFHDQKAYYLITVFSTIPERIYERDKSFVKGLLGSWGKRGLLSYKQLCALHSVYKRYESEIKNYLN